eukprot:COSAG01_NODE_2355_length_7841_cov_647.664815_1_plen_480_part_00
MLVRVGIIGMGGFARSLHAAVLALEQEQGSSTAMKIRLVCACSQRGQQAPEVEEYKLRVRGVAVFTNWLDMLDSCSIDVVVIPTPVHEHARMHAECVRRGLYIYLEKPPTLNVAELESMLDLEARAQAAQRMTHVGFNFQVEVERQQLKQRLLGGEFGSVRECWMEAAWPRSTRYYQPNSWRGRLRHGGTLVLDSCAGNALAHHVFNMLQWCGAGGDTDEDAWAEIQTVEAELYRAHDIQSADTVFACIHTASACGGVPIRLAVTHACSNSDTWHEEVVCCERATIRYRTFGTPCWTVQWHDSTRPMESGDSQLTPSTMVAANIRAYCEYVCGERARPLVRLRDTRSFVEFITLMYVSSGGVTPVSGAEQVRQITVPQPGGGGGGGQIGEEELLLQIRGVREAMAAFVQRGLWPRQHQLLSGDAAPWGARGRGGTDDEDDNDDGDEDGTRQVAAMVVGRDQLGKLDAVVARMEAASAKL